MSGKMLFFYLQRGNTEFSLSKLSGQRSTKIINFLLSCLMYICCCKQLAPLIKIPFLVSQLCFLKDLYL